MTMFRVVHRTAYEYSRPMGDGFSIATLLPRDTPWQSVLSTSFEVEPTPDELEERADRFGNRILRFGVHRAHTSLVVVSDSQVDVRVADQPVAGTLGDAVAITASARGAMATDIDPFLGASAHVPVVSVVDDLVAPLTDASRPVVDVVSDWCRTIFESFRFDPMATDVSTPVAEVVAQRHGVCQDFAHVAIAGLRHLGLAARYVSGYLETMPAPGQPKLVGADASHAWCSVFLPGFGWTDLDPTNDQFPPQRHVTVGWGRDYADVAPLRGVVIGPPGSQELAVAVDVVAT
jgi:transglutaminase-like putative cysteine protease